MLRQGKLRRGISVVALGAICSATPARADLEQLGDALADVATFGAWGQSRDLHAAELAKLKAHYELELQRAQNLAEARVATTRIEGDVRNAANSQYVGQQMLKVLAMISLLEAQLKQIVVERYQTRSNVTRFSTWFDSFATGKDTELRALLKLMKQLNANDDKSIDALLKAAQLEKAQTDDDAAHAASYLKAALETANSNSAREALGTLEQIRVIVTAVLETQRQNIRQLVTEMAADDLARRTLCAPPEHVEITCDNQGACRYYSADPQHPMPCNGLTYFDSFPVAAIETIVAHPENYAANAEFFVRLDRLTLPGKVTKNAFSSSSKIFGQDLKPESLLPPPFLLPDRCTNVDRYAKRLREALDYLAIFEQSDETTAATRANIVHLQQQRPLVEFWLDTLHDAVPTAANCAAMPQLVRRRATMLVLAVAAAEAFDASLTARDDGSEDAARLAPIDTLAKDF